MLARGAVPAYQAHLDRGQALSAERHFVPALTAFEAAARLAPDDPEPYARMGQSLYRMDRYPEALEAYRGDTQTESNSDPTEKRD